MELVMRVCDQIYVLDFGDVIASGTPETIRKNPMVQAAYLGEAEPDGDPGDTRSAPASRRWSGERRGGTRCSAAPSSPNDRPSPSSRSSCLLASWWTTFAPPTVASRSSTASIWSFRRAVSSRCSVRTVPASGRCSRSSTAACARRRAGAWWATSRWARDPREAGQDRLCAIPEGRGIFPNLTVRENLRMWTYRGGGSRPGGRGADLRHVSPSEGAPPADGRDAVGGRAADAGHLPGAGHRAQGPPAGRDVHGPGPHHRRTSSTSWSATLADQGMTILLVEQFVTTALGRGHPGRHHGARPHRAGGDAPRRWPTPPSASIWPDRPGATGPRPGTRPPAGADP